MTNDEIIEAVLTREGGFTSDSNDRGGLTVFGISKAANPSAWLHGPPTLEQAKQIYLTRYIVQPGFDTIPESHNAVKCQLVDWGVNSGVAVAVMGLQRVLGTAQDGVFGPATLKALVATDMRRTNNELMKQRVLMLGRIVKRAPSQVRYVEGWLNRALSFMV